MRKSSILPSYTPRAARYPASAENYKMHVPSMGFNTSGPIEIQEVIFGWLADIEAKQELVDIVEFGSTVTCYLHISDKDGTVVWWRRGEPTSLKCAFKSLF